MINRLIRAARALVADDDHIDLEAHIVRQTLAAERTLDALNGTGKLLSQIRDELREPQPAWLTEHADREMAAIEGMVGLLDRLCQVADRWEEGRKPPTPIKLGTFYTPDAAAFRHGWLTNAHKTSPVDGSATTAREEKEEDADREDATTRASSRSDGGPTWLRPTEGDEPQEPVKSFSVDELRAQQANEVQARRATCAHKVTRECALGDPDCRSCVDCGEHGCELRF